MEVSMKEIIVRYGVNCNEKKNIANFRIPKETL